MNKLIPPLEWHTEKRLVRELIPYQYNPRKLTEANKERLRKSLEKFNLAEIPAVNTDNTIIAGHQRIMVLMEIGRGDETVDVRVPNRLLTEEEFKEYNVRSNVQVGDWDLDILEEFFTEINLDEIGLDLEELKNLDVLPENLRVEEEQEFDPIPSKKVITQPGDIYEFKSTQKGLKHSVLCGDSTLASNYKKLLLGNLFDLLITDPPYNVNYTGGTKEKLTIKNDKMDNDSFYSFLYLFYQEAFLNAKNGCGAYIFHADSEGANFRTAFIKSGWKLSQCLIWLKNSIVMGRQDYHWKHEPILYGWKEGAAHSWYSDRKQSTVLEFDKPFRNADHPTMKPLELIIYLIKNSSQQKNNVGDLFLGSGSTLIACEQTWRNCFGMELDPKYVDVIVRRWISYMNDNDLAFEILKNSKKLTQEEISIYVSNS